MATALSTLEDMRMIERKPDSTDGRQVNIRLTARGASMRKTSRDASQEWLSSAIAKLSKKEQATLFEAGEIMKRLAEL
jgi:DNA-binding MarR family transcriptional regulator